MRTFEPDPRRIFLTAFFVLWLSAQHVVAAGSPAWGWILPHEHVTRGAMTERAWQEHLREHRLNAGAMSGWICDQDHATTSDHLLASVPSLRGTLSLLTLLGGALQSIETHIPALALPPVSVHLTGFNAFDISYLPLQPPPNLYL